MVDYSCARSLQLCPCLSTSKLNLFWSWVIHTIALKKKRIRTRNWIPSEQPNELPSWMSRIFRWDWRANNVVRHWNDTLCDTAEQFVPPFSSRNPKNHAVWQSEVWTDSIYRHERRDTTVEGSFWWEISKLLYISEKLYIGANWVVMLSMISSVLFRIFVRSSSELQNNGQWRSK